jgi:hypothetical protein
MASALEGLPDGVRSVITSMATPVEQFSLCLTRRSTRRAFWQHVKALKVRCLTRGPLGRSSDDDHEYLPNNPPPLAGLYRR